MLATVAGAAVCVTPLALVPAEAGTPQRRPVALPALSAATMRALQRDLKLSEAGVRSRLAAEVAAGRLEATLKPKLGAAYAGSWFDVTSGKLVVAVTDEAQAGTVRRAGAGVRVVEHGLAELDAAVRRLEPTLKARGSSVTGWGVDPRANSIVVTTAEGAAMPMAASLGGVPIRYRTAGAMARTGGYVDAGEQSAIDLRKGFCSIGFNVQTRPTRSSAWTGRGFLSAGHCVKQRNTSVFGADDTRMGYVRALNLSTDWAVVEVNEPAWVSGPWISTQQPDDSYWAVHGSQVQPQFTTVCKSGIATGVTCGPILERNQTRRVEGGQWVQHVTVYGACAERGDSGGPVFSVGASQAQGITVAATLSTVHGAEVCGQKAGTSNESAYQEVTHITNTGLTRIMT